MASCDFSTRVYSYCDTPGDFQLKTFALAREDLELKAENMEKFLKYFQIPFIKWANQLSGNKLRLFASPWSAPGWMKSSGKMQGPGRLRSAEYLKITKFFHKFSVAPFKDPISKHMPIISDVSSSSIQSRGTLHFGG